ncbi:MAG: DUF3987 domain-containing protein [Alphaproteobacteria bacterium]|nr:MAG: DUF3987 domain-containing protein [Alphaproteobacteria bacterium]
MFDTTHNDAAQAAQPFALPEGFAEIPPSSANEWKPLSGAYDSTTSPPAPLFPLATLPPMLAQVIHDAALSKSAPIGYVASTVLSLAGGLIGISRSINPKHDWYEPPTLWMMIVGAPSSNKSPAMDVCSRIIEELELEINSDYEALKAEYQEKMKLYEAQEKLSKEQTKKALKDGDALPDKEEAIKQPHPPRRKRIVVTTGSIEQIAELVQQNPRGLCMVRDEMAGLLMNMERYGGGTDRQFYIESFGGRRYTVDTRNRPEPLIIQRLLLTLLGGIQPQRLTEIFHASTDDGLSARFLYDCSDRVPIQRHNTRYDKKLLMHIFTRLYKLELRMDQYGTPQSISVPFEEDARDCLFDYAEHLAQREQEADGLLESHIGKMRGYVVRIAGVLAFLDWAVGTDWDEPTSIEKHTVERAITLVDAYYLPMAVRCFGDMALPQEQRDARLILKWLSKQRTAILDASQLPRAKNSPLRDRKRRDHALDFMCEAGIIKERGKTTEKGGRPALLYDVHPELVAQWR